MPKKFTKRTRVSNKPPGASPASAHLEPMERKRKSVPKASHPGANLGKHLYPPKAKGVGPAKKLNATAKRVADDITKSKHTMKGY
jgi:hypothetical protein